MEIVTQFFSPCDDYRTKARKINHLTPIKKWSLVDWRKGYYSWMWILFYDIAHNKENGNDREYEILHYVPKLVYQEMIHDLTWYLISYTKGGSQNNFSAWSSKPPGGWFLRSLLLVELEQHRLRYFHQVKKLIDTCFFFPFFHRTIRLLFWSLRSPIPCLLVNIDQSTYVISATK